MRNKTLMYVTALSLSLLISGCGAQTTPEGTKPEQAETTEATETKKEESKAAPETDGKKDTSDESSEVELINFKNELNYDYLYMDPVSGKEQKLLAIGHYPSLELGFFEDGTFMEYQGLYSELSDSLSDYNKEVLERFKSLLDECKEQAADDKGFTEESDDMYEYYYTVDIDAEVTRSDSVAFSILDTTYACMNYPHPFTGFHSLNIDSETGKVLKISDVITDKDKFIDRLAEKLHEENPDLDNELAVSDLNATLKDMYDEIDGMSLTFNLTHDSLDISFGPDEITFYAVGEKHVSLRFSDNADIIDPKYTKATENYAASIGFKTPVTFKAKDGSERTLTVEYETAKGEYMDDCYDITIDLDGEKFTDTIMYTYNLYPYIMYQDKQAFLYIRTRTDNDYEMTNIYDLNGKTAAKVEEDLGVSFYSTAPIDPSDFIMYSRSDILSTYTIFRHYELDTDGRPLPQTEEWWIQTDRKLKLKSPLTVSVMDELSFDGIDNGKDEKLPEGTTLRAARTNGFSWVDCELEDGRFARLYIDNSDWPQTVDGTDIETLFDGIVFAG